ncbi:hypothetical protein Tco_1516698 [Tanacetum coccineum]
MDGRVVGVEDLDDDLAAATMEGRVVGVEDLDADFTAATMDGRLVGVEDLDDDLAAATMEGRAVGVEDLEDDFEAEGSKEGREVGVMDLFEGATGLVAAKVARDVGVDDLDGFVVEDKVGRAVGVADLGTVDEAFLDGDGRLMVLLEDFTPLEDVESLSVVLAVKVVSAGGFSNYNAVNEILESIMT